MIDTIIIIEDGRVVFNYGYDDITGKLSFEKAITLDDETGIIYKATSPSGKVYIGQTTKSLDKRKNEHYNKAFNKNVKVYNYPISRAIRKYNNDIIHKELAESPFASVWKIAPDPFFGASF